jgi:hypothetical protein
MLRELAIYPSGFGRTTWPAICIDISREVLNNMKLYFVSWAALAGLVAVLTLYRKFLADGHYTVLHVRRSELPQVPVEFAYAQRLARIDRWGKCLTWSAFTYGVALLVLYAYRALS